MAIGRIRPKRNREPRSDVSNAERRKKRRRRRANQILKLVLTGKLMAVEVAAQLARMKVVGAEDEYDG